MDGLLEQFQSNMQDDEKFYINHSINPTCFKLHFTAMCTVTLKII